MTANQMNMLLDLRAFGPFSMSEMEARYGKRSWLKVFHNLEKQGKAKFVVHTEDPFDPLFYKHFTAK